MEVLPRPESLDLRLDASFTDFESKLKDGELILVVKERETITGCPGIVPPKQVEPWFFSVERSYILGILGPGKLSHAEEKMVIPTKRYVEFDRNKVGEVKKGPIVIEEPYSSHFGMRVPIRTEPVPYSSLSLEYGLLVFVGEKEILPVMERMRLRAAYARARRMLY